jgi:putative transposase
MVNNPRNRHRRSIRLKAYDYTQPGAYFVTLCTDDRQLLFGEITDGAMHLNRMGLIVQNTWLDLPRHYPHVVLDAIVIMPNHVHAVIVLTDNGITHKKRHGLPEIVRAFKSFSAKRINALRRTPGRPVWQRNYYDHIVRNEDEWEGIRAYIQNNPQEWDAIWKIHRSRVGAGLELLCS